MNTADTVRAQSRKDPMQLEHEIDQQRDHIGEIIHALENKLSPGEIFDKVLGNGKGGREFAGNLARTVRDNPMPTLLTVAGLAWLYTGSHASHATTTTTSDKPGIGERVGHAREQMSGRMDSAKQHVGDSAHHAMESARMRARSGKQGFEHMLDDNPMAIGAMAIAAGALLGAMLPPTRKEDELIGPMRDRFADDARHAARSGYDTMAETGREVTAGEHDGSGGAHSTTTSTTTPSGTSARPGL
ncbi:DUF3618 domain-containing protein [Novilysobacter erysipheiresistens]|uniref:DUF3618 domain-containing protein n=1 Tax=Novilysobacter erysipheiresistens TaxID=1749332 RepID=A0ABU7YZU0_9GAMM